MRDDIMARVFWISILFLLAITACSSSNGLNATQTNLPPPDTTYTARTAEFRAGPFDEVQIRVRDMSDLNGTYYLNLDGRTKLPMLGDMDFAGKTSFEIATLIEERLSATYLQSPDVVVSLKPAFIEQVTVEGAIRKPGTYDAKPGLTLLETIALSGGASETANQRRAIIVRTIDGQRQMAAFDLIAIREGSAADPLIYGNDLIIVDGSRVRSVFLDIVRTSPIIAVFRPLF
ncbi:hypothetical protein BBF93_13125 [Hyphomonas sp. CACIAM 19H1]|uniref:polysaccharide biosynthesis/export family protein n=1 Tax=Hyphomonas sp. CACIAM 19H1 TaxID=1873716 RepID=UPI000DEE0E6E|nr:polysaccharide biosynthesis/export family protein [Hyphomonas sp. CACIAM 19H1]AXE65056.1 hypothetical protein BBF93_13125 [Hyphomonas sp. CACIAM 19H1]